MIKVVIDGAENEVAKKVAVHPGVFHSDDVVACAIALYKFGNLEISRVPFNPSFNPNEYDFILELGKTYDGTKWFDHHQDTPVYSDGIMPCAASLLAEYLFEEELYNELYKRALKAICAQDNGQAEFTKDFPNTEFGWIHTMNPAWNEPRENTEVNFRKAVLMAYDILKTLISKITADIAAEDVWAKRKEEDGVIILPCFIPWQERAVDTECKFIVFESNRAGEFALWCIPPDVDNMFSQRQPLPAEWSMPEGDKPEGLIFAMKQRCFASFNSMENAIKAAKSL